MVEEKPSGDFTRIPVHPTVGDIRNKAVLRKNKETGSKYSLPTLFTI